MDEFASSIHREVICLGGSQGITVDEFWSIVERIYLTQFKTAFQDALKGWIWPLLLQLRPFTLNGKLLAGGAQSALASTTAIIGVPEEHRIAFYCQNRYLKLNDFAMKTLEVIGKRRGQGITQSDAAKLLQMDPRSFFHQMKPLIAFGLVTKIPVSYQRSFTYLLFLKCFGPREEIEDEEEDPKIPTKVKPDPAAPSSMISVMDMRAKIMDILQASPSKMQSYYSAAFTALRTPQTNARLFRRNVNWLIKKGFLECEMDKEMNVRILKFKKHLTDASLKKAPKVAPSFMDLTKDYCYALRREGSLESQIVRFIDDNGPEGCTLTQIMHAFGLTRKYGYRIVERLTDGKSVPTSGVVKISEFIGKERRHRFFTEAGKQRRSDSQSQEAGLETESSAPSSVVRDSVTRNRRLQALLKIIDESIIVEAGKALIGTLQRQLNETEYSMDGKTLKRMVDQLETEGKVKSLIVVLPKNQNKTILIRGDIAVDDPQVEQFVTNMRTNKLELSLDPEKMPEVPASGPLAKTGKESKSHMQKYGFVFGVMQRCRLLHEYLVSSISNKANIEWICETLPVLFRRMTLGLFLKIIGVGEGSTELLQFVSNPLNTSLELQSLPPSIKNELHRRRVDRQKMIIKQLMDLLHQLGLVAADNRYPSIAFRLPYQYRLSRCGAITDPKSGQVKENVDFSNVDAVHKYWDHLQAQVGLADNESQAAVPLPPVYDLIKRKESWQTASPFSRAFRRAIRKVYQERDMMSLEELHDAIGQVAMEYEVDLAMVERAYSELNDARERDRIQRAAIRRERREAKLRKPRLIQPKPSLAESGGEEGEEEVGGELRHRRAILPEYSSEELASLSVAYLLLLEDRYKTSIGTLQWSLIADLYNRNILKGSQSVNRTSEDLRLLFHRLMLSLPQLFKLEAIEWKYYFMKAALKAGKIRLPESSQSDDDIHEQFASEFVFFDDSIKNYGSIEKSTRLPEGTKLKDIDMAKMIQVDDGTMKSYFDVRKLNRTQQMQHFFHHSPLVVLPVNDSALYTRDLLPEMQAIRRTFTIPLESYSAQQVSTYLATFDAGRLQAAVDELIKIRLLSKSETTKYHQKIPSSELYIHEDFIALLEEPEDSTESVEGDLLALQGSFDLLSVLEKVVFDEAHLDWSMSGREMNITMRNASHTQRDPKQALSAAIKHLNKTQDVLVWLDDSGSCNETLLISCGMRVREEIKERPGVSRQNLVKSLFPILLDVEIDFIIDLLSKCNEIESEAGLPNYFLKTS